MAQQQETILIIGAGMVGVSTALALQQMGKRVILLDRQGAAAGASFGNGGVLASCAIVPVPGPGLLKKVPLMLFSSNQPLFMKWRYLPKLLPWLVPYLKHANAEDAATTAKAITPIIGDSVNDHLALAKGTKAARYIVPSDYVFAYKNRSAYEAEAFTWGLRRDNGFKWDEISGKAVQDYEPLYGPEIGFLVRCPDHGRITDPGAYVQALAEHFVSQGGDFRLGNVEAILREGGMVTGAKVDGETITCDRLVITAGIWSKQIMQMLGLHVPMESERGYHMELWNPSSMPEVPSMVAASKFVVTPMEGRLRLAGIVEFGGLDLPASQAPLDLLERAIRAAMPSLKWERATTWLGHRPAPVDSLPAIGEIGKNSGIYTGFGHHHVGLTGGPKTGRLLAQIIAGQNPNLDMTPYDPNRFAQ